MYLLYIWADQLSINKINCIHYMQCRVFVNISGYKAFLRFLKQSVTLKRLRTTAPRVLCLSFEKECLWMDYWKKGNHCSGCSKHVSRAKLIALLFESLNMFQKNIQGKLNCFFLLVPNTGLHLLYHFVPKYATQGRTITWAHIVWVV